jgi:hypothetical protein
MYLEPIAVRNPEVELGETENKTAIIDINWTNIFILNGPLMKYEVLINNETYYQGIETQFKAAVNITDCVANKSKLIEEHANTGVDYGYFDVQIQIRAYNNMFESLSPLLELQINCTSIIIFVFQSLKIRA